MNKDDILAYIRERYTYDAETGTIRHKGKDRPVKGAINSHGYLKFGEKFKSKTSFRAVIDKTYLHLPVYSKKNKEWIFKNMD